MAINKSNVVKVIFVLIVVCVVFLSLRVKRDNPDYINSEFPSKFILVKMGQE